MVKELKEVLTKVEQLPENEQRIIARMLNEEMLWDATLENSQDLLAKLAEEAIREHKAGKTKSTEW
jgi:hypothetical protein